MVFGDLLKESLRWMDNLGKLPNSMPESSLILSKEKANSNILVLLTNFSKECALKETEWTKKESILDAAGVRINNYQEVHQWNHLIL